MKEDKINVFVRIRPLNEKQLREGSSTFIEKVDQTQIIIKDKEKQCQNSFAFDQIFGIKSEQIQIYQKVGKPVVDAAFQGFNGTIFAYGQTSSGKTYTCIGPDFENHDHSGILPRLILQTFEKISNHPAYIQFRIKVTMVEIYMQKIKDLLDPTKLDVKIRQNKSKGIYLQDITEEYVSSPQQSFRIIKKGITNRSVGSTNMNEHSSRSHMAFIITIYQNNLKDLAARSGKIILVDLAGSEKVSKTLAEGKVLDEAKNINKSLSALGNVINALTEAKSSHIPYRDSKLTRLLQQSLGGNSKTNLIVNISPSITNSCQSISSLRFGFRVKEIKNKPKINRQYTIAELLLLLQKSQKKNIELENIIKQLSSNFSRKKLKKDKSSFIQNLLDSDNPIMSDLSDNEKQSQLLEQRQSQRHRHETIKKKFMDQPIKSEELNTINIQYQLQKQADKIAQISNQAAQMKQQIITLLSEIQTVTQEKIQLSRQLQIYKQKLECIIKQYRVNTHKLNSQKRQNQNILQKYIKESIQNQEMKEKNQEMKSVIQSYEQKISRLSQIQKQASKKSNLFGLNNKSNDQASQILYQALSINKGKVQSQLSIQKLQNQETSKQQKIKYLQKKVKELQINNSFYVHLEKAKQDLIKEKLSFISERERVYKDLQNRIEKVLELEERLDEEKQKRKYYEQLINLQQDQKAKRLISLQKYCHEMSENYYVLKGQQSSWLKNNKNLQQKIKQSKIKLIKLQEENIELRGEIEALKIKCDDLESNNQNASFLDTDYIFDEQQPKHGGNIIKVVRSDLCL